MNNTKIVINENEIVLELDDIENCRFELWTVGNKTTGSVKIKIPDEVWNKIINEWKKQRGGK